MNKSFLTLNLALCAVLIGCSSNNSSTSTPHVLEKTPKGPPTTSELEGRQIEFQMDDKKVYLESYFSKTCTEDDEECVATEWISMPENSTARFYKRTLINGHRGWDEKNLKQEAITAAEFENIQKSFHGKMKHKKVLAPLRLWARYQRYLYKISLQRCRQHPVVRAAKAKPIFSEGNIVLKIPKAFGLENVGAEITTTLEWNPRKNRFEYLGAINVAYSPENKEPYELTESQETPDRYILSQHPRRDINIAGFQMYCGETYLKWKASPKPENLDYLDYFWPSPDPDNFNDNLATEDLAELKVDEFMHGVSDYRIARLLERFINIYYPILKTLYPGVEL